MVKFQLTTILITTFVSISTWAASSPSPINRFVERLDNCQAINFSSFGFFSAVAPIDGRLDSSAMQIAIQHDGSITRGQMGYGGGYQNLNYLSRYISFDEPIGYKDALSELTRVVESATDNNLPTGDMQDFYRLVEQKIAKNSRQSGQPSCVNVRVAYGGAGKIIAQPLTSQTMDQIRTLFLNRDKGLHFNLPKEIEMLNSNRLNRDEIIELRGLREASRIVGQSTIIRFDKGGYLGNLAIGSKVRMRCQDVAFTYQQFFKALEAGGLIRNFEVLTQQVSRDMKGWIDGHLAVGLRNNRTNEVFVFDAYHLDGGSAGQIVTIEDWLNYNDFENVVDEK